MGRHVSAAGFQQVEKPHQIALRVGVRAVDGVTHTGLGGQVDDLIETLLGEQIQQTLFVGQVQLLKLKVAVRGQLRQPRLFELDAVIAVEVIDPHHLMTFAAQTSGRVKADETCGASDQYSHALTSMTLRNDTFLGCRGLYQPRMTVL